MSAGANIQLQSVGRQDVDTIIQPDLTFWKSQYPRHTPFVMEPKIVEFQGNYAWNRRFYGKPERIADLITRVWLYVELGNLDSGNGGARFCDDVGRAMWEDIVLEIGGTQFDRLVPEEQHSWEELTTIKERQLGRLTGKGKSIAQLIEWAKNTQYLYIPLNLYFTDDYGNAMPLIGMHLSDVKIYVKMKRKEDVIVGVGLPYTVQSTDAELINMYLLMETIILDDPERDFFASTPMKWVITQHQYMGSQTIRAGLMQFPIDLQFNHPCKELIMLYRTATNLSEKNYFSFGGEETGALNGDAFKTLSFRLNSNDRFKDMGPLYFRILQPQMFHSRIPNKHVYVYSFALYPEDPAPSGSLNFSRVDTAKLVFVFSAALADSAEMMIHTRNINSCTLGKGVLLLTFAS